MNRSKHQSTSLRFNQTQRIELKQLQQPSYSHIMAAKCQQGTGFFKLLAHARNPGDLSATRKESHYSIRDTATRVKLCQKYKPRETQKNRRKKYTKFCISLCKRNFLSLQLCAATLPHENRNARASLPQITPYIHMLHILFLMRTTKNCPSEKKMPQGAQEARKFGKTKTISFTAGKNTCSMAQFLFPHFLASCATQNCLEHLETIAPTSFEPGPLPAQKVDYMVTAIVDMNLWALYI